MTALKWIAIGVAGYLALVALFETMLGTVQPGGAGTLVITTIDADGMSHDRVVSRLESGGQMYVAANHWPRAWYRRAMENPEVRVTLNGATGEYVAVPVTGEEHARVDADNPLGLVFRFLTGFPPRYFVRLDQP